MRFVAAAFLIGLLLLPAGACGDPADSEKAQHEGEISVAAASSLRELLTSTAPIFEKEHPGSRLRFSFEASSALARKIPEGAPFDAFLSADADSMDRVVSEIDPATRAPFLSNRLALVRRAGLPNPAPSPKHLAAREGNIAIAGPAVPAGKYARAYLEKAGLLPALLPRFVEADSVRAALALVESGAADYGFVYETDTHAARTAKTLWIDTGREGPEIRYVAAVLSRTRAPQARAYARWLRSDRFLSAAEALGFLRLAE
jgi:molybdate transport system substrate-binding protein